MLVNILNPYWNTLRKDLAQKGISFITIVNSSNIFCHPVGIAIMLSFGIFSMPQNPNFYLFWIVMIIVSSISSIFSILGLLETKFFINQVVGKLGFATSAIFAFLILGEELDALKTISILFGIVGIAFFVWKKDMRHFSIDKGLIFIIISTILGGLAAVFYKLAAFSTPDYISFLTGRFVGDLIGWTMVWLISLIILKRSPTNELSNYIKEKSGKILILGAGIITLLESWLIYKLPISLLAVLGTLSFPSSYFFSHIKYREKITARMWIGTFCILISVIIFIIS
ncbi:MAG: hypothetical protein ACP5NV_02740 [Candidatus Woesearchaeota archaeon]